MKNSPRKKKPSTPAFVLSTESVAGECAPTNLTDLAAIRREVEAKNLARYPEHAPQDVAEVASRLLGTGNDFDATARRAMSLLDACVSAVNSRRKVREANNVGQMRNRDISAHLPYREGLKHITGQTRTDRAKKDFLEFLPYFYADRSIPEKITPRKFTKPELAKTIARYEREGFLWQELAEGKRLFLIWRKIQK